LLGRIEEILPCLPKDVSVWGMNDSVPQGVVSLKQKLSTSSDEPLPCSHHVVSNLKSTSLYIFTSGTTGRSQFFLRLKRNAAYCLMAMTRQTGEHAREKTQASQILELSNVDEKLLALNLKFYSF
jgi:hypothetical protein